MKIEGKVSIVLLDNIDTDIIYPGRGATSAGARRDNYGPGNAKYVLFVQASRGGVGGGLIPQRFINKIR